MQISVLRKAFIRLSNYLDGDWFKAVCLQNEPNGRSELGVHERRTVDSGESVLLNQREMNYFQH